MIRTRSSIAKLGAATAGGALALALAVGATASTTTDASAAVGSSSSSSSTSSTTRDWGRFGTQPWGGSTGIGSGGTTDPGTAGSGALGSGGARSSTGTQVAAAGEATAAQVSGVVDIVTTVDYDQGEAAGTGIVLTSGGRILTNNHVVDGATSISVTVLSTGRTYQASVVGTSPTNDIAVLQLEGASGLTMARLGDSSSVGVGDEVVGVGNAGNDAGTSAAAGTVTAVDQQITASDGTAASAKTLTGLIEIAADIRSGDSGGPLYDASGTVVGIDTAAQTTARGGSTVAGYAIPINHALDVARQIVAGVDDATIHQGLPAFLGLQLAPWGTGTTIAGVVDGGAAEAAGLGAGDTLTSVGGTSVASPDEISAAVASHDPGDRVKVTWTDAGGVSHSATVTLGSGPAD
jgi:S1-C subfamily serine protease